MQQLIGKQGKIFVYLAVESSGPRAAPHVNLFKFSVRWFRKGIPCSEGSRQRLYTGNNKVAVLLCWTSVGKSSSKASRLHRCLMKWGGAVGEHWWPCGQDLSAPLLLPLAAKAGITCWLRDCWHKSDDVVWGCAKSLFLLGVSFKCRLLLMNLRLLSHSLSRLHTPESVDSKLEFSLSNAQKLFSRSECLSSVFSKCLFQICKIWRK